MVLSGEKRTQMECRRYFDDPKSRPLLPNSSPSQGKLATLILQQSGVLAHPLSPFYSSGFPEPLAHTLIQCAKQEQYWA